MKGHRSFSALGFLLIAVFLFTACPRESPEAPTDIPTLDTYDFVARGKMSRDRGARPEDIARMDNNGEILAACLKPISVEALERKGIKFLRSQLGLLVDWNLLEYDREDETYHTTVYVYGEEKASALRDLVREAADELAKALGDDLIVLKDDLEKIGREKSLFAILFAYVLHDYSMQQLGEEIYGKPQLSAERPFWNGYSWAVYPIQKFHVGVTALPGDGATVFKVSPRSAPGPSFQQLFSFVQDVTADSRVDDPEEIKNFMNFGVCDDQGELTIPVFEGDRTRKLTVMAERVYSATVELVESDEMAEILGMETRAQAAMFIHYELRYAFLAGLLEDGMIEAPIDFDNAPEADPRDVGNLIFLVKSKPSDT